MYFSLVEYCVRYNKPVIIEWAEIMFLKTLKKKGKAGRREIAGEKEGGRKL